MGHPLGYAAGAPEPARAHPLPQQGRQGPSKPRVRDYVQLEYDHIQWISTEGLREIVRTCSNFPTHAARQQGPLTDPCMLHWEMVHMANMNNTYNLAHMGTGRMWKGRRTAGFGCGRSPTELSSAARGLPVDADLLRNSISWAFGGFVGTTPPPVGGPARRGLGGMATERPTGTSMTISHNRRRPPPCWRRHANGLLVGGIVVLAVVASVVLDTAPTAPPAGVPDPLDSNPLVAWSVNTCLMS